MDRLLNTNLSENEQRALQRLRDELFEKYQIVDIRLYGSKARGQGNQDSDLDVMIEISDYNQAVATEIDNIIFNINLEQDVYISILVFTRDEIENGPMSEAPIYKAIQRESVPI